MWEQHVYLCDQNKSSESDASGVWDKLQWTWLGSPSTLSKTIEPREKITPAVSAGHASQTDQPTVCEISNSSQKRSDSELKNLKSELLPDKWLVSAGDRYTDWELQQCYMARLNLFDVAAQPCGLIWKAFLRQPHRVCMHAWAYLNLSSVCAHGLQRHCSTSLTEGLLLIKQLCERGLHVVFTFEIALVHQRQRNGGISKVSILDAGGKRRVAWAHEIPHWGERIFI